MIIRGGGSADDLAVFNDEKLVRAVANSRIPIIIWIDTRLMKIFAIWRLILAASTPSNVASNFN